LRISAAEPRAADCERVSIAEIGALEQRVAGTDLEDGGATVGVRAALAHRGLHPEQRQVIACEDILGSADPLVGIALEIVEQMLRKQLVRMCAHEAVGQLRRAGHHFGDDVLKRILVEAGLRKRREVDRVSGFEEKPLKVREQGLRMLIDRGLGLQQQLGMLARDANGGDGLHGTLSNTTHFRR
jgi:hypothetical protein